jgi:serine/threonine-protein kinase
VSDEALSEELSDEPSDFGSLRPGTRLGRYELLLPIARGGMARVWAARQHGTRGFQKLVAIKTILPHLADEPEFERMFLDEARIASGVHHPNVCEIYELGEERRVLYLAMEWVNGDSFSRALRASGRTEACDFGIAARIIADACAGAHAAHELEDEDGRKQNVVHRDLSPHNILINWDGVTKVCDFGVAKALNQLHEHTQAGQLKGKISYMSPEQVTGDPVDRRSDVFSLGCVLYEATTGKRPFRGEGEHNVMQSIVDGQFEPPSAILRNYPRDLERIVTRALGHIPNQRFASAEHMRFALEEFLAKGPLVSQSHVATLVRARLGEMLERRRERIKQASSEQAKAQWDPKGVPPSRDPIDHRSGVKPSSQPSLGHARPERADQTSFGRVTTDQILSMQALGSSSTSTVPHSPAAIAQSVDTAETTGVVLPPRVGMSMESARATSSIEEAIKASLVPNPLEVVPPSGASPRSVMEARALTAPARDVPIPIMSPMTGPPMGGPRPGPMTGPPSMARALEGPAPVEEPPAGLGQYALAAFVGLLFAVAIGGAGLYFWKSRQTVVVLAPPPPAIHSGTSAPVTAPAASGSSAVDALAPSAPPSADAPVSVPSAAPPPAVSAKKPKPKPKPTDPNALPENPY